MKQSKRITKKAIMDIEHYYFMINSLYKKSKSVLDYSLERREIAEGVLERQQGLHDLMIDWNIERFDIRGFEIEKIFFKDGSIRKQR